jgi:hypothetical protein
MDNNTLIFESAKLLLQFAGALVIARLAVNWALSRYKSEKTWERRLSAYVDAVTAISEMRLVTARWYDEILEHREPTEENRNIRQERYQKARRRLDDGIAAARLLLANSTADALEDLERKLERNGNQGDLVEALDNEIGHLTEALNLLIEQGRRSLAIS